jgi:hypothetical protein
MATALVLALSGCTTGTGGSPSASATPTPLSTPTPSASPAASPSASVSPTPTVITVDCSADGIVPGRLNCIDTNLPVAGNPGESSLAWEDDLCAPGDGRFVFTAASTMVGLGGEDGDKIGRIDVYDPSLTTAEGIHVGSPAADVAAAYPATPAVTAFSGTQLVVLSGSEGFVTIELADGWGADPLTVANIRIYAADQDPNVPVYGSGNFAGACPMDF